MSETPGTDLITKGQRPNIETGREILPLIPRNFDDVIRYARMFLVAKAIPDALTKNSGGGLLADDEIIAKTFAVIAAGAEVGMGPVASTRWITVINNRTNIWGAGAVGCLHRSGKLEDMIVEKLGSSPNSDTPTDKYSHDYGYRVTLKRKGMPTPFTGEFTVGMAIRAHLWMNSKKRPWIEHPDDQLYWRAFHRASVRGFSDALNGMGIAEIAEEEPEIDVKTDDSFLDDAPPSNGQDPQNGSAVQPPQASEDDDSPPASSSDEQMQAPLPPAGAANVIGPNEQAQREANSYAMMPDSQREESISRARERDRLEAANDWYADWWKKAAELGDWRYESPAPKPSAKMLRYELIQIIKAAPGEEWRDRFVVANGETLLDLKIIVPAKASDQ